jgi:predicted N-acetyltransferase YhbS
LLIRTEDPSDIPAIRRLNRLAFSGATEAKFVDQTRRSETDFDAFDVAIQAIWALPGAPKTA